MVRRSATPTQVVPQHIRDTLGEAAITEGTDQISYKDASGNTQTYTLTYTSYYQKTAFNCSGITDISGTTELPFLTSVAVPGGGSYTFEYEITPGKGSGYTTPGQNGQYTTGRIGKITFPSGGSISYSYSDSSGHNGVNCTSQVVPTLTVTVNDNNGNNGTWTYVNSNTTSQSSCVAGKGPCNFTVTETDPVSNQTIYSFAGEFQTQAARYKGAATGTPLEIILTCYNNEGLSQCAAPSGLSQSNHY
jgi:hypothetical protein